MSDEQNIKRVCSFCVSDLHLVTMLLPYLDKKIKENEKFIRTGKILLIFRKKCVILT